MITKKIAGDLYGNGFMLQDKEGVHWHIHSCGYRMLTLSNPIKKFKKVLRSQIGTDYHILARPLDLTKEITHKGETFVPIVELAKTCLNIKHIINKCFDSKFNQIQFTALQSNYIFQATTNNDFLLRKQYTEGIGSYAIIVHNQNTLFDKLRELNFAIGLPEGSWIPVTDNNNPYK